MKPVVIVNPPRAGAGVVDELGGLGVATVHEAAGQTGLLGTALRPAWAGARAAGTALTVLCGPGDNLMLHVAIEQSRPGDLLVVTTTSPSSDGFVGELIATSLAAREVRGLVTTTGVRDVAAITAARFPVWSQFISAQGTQKAFAGAVNVPVSIAGTAGPAGGCGGRRRRRGGLRSPGIRSPGRGGREEPGAAGGRGPARFRPGRAGPGPLPAAAGAGTARRDI